MIKPSTIHTRELLCLKNYQSDEFLLLTKRQLLILWQTIFFGKKSEGQY
jgi:hypothetical protein